MQGMADLDKFIGLSGAVGTGNREPVQFFRGSPRVIRSPGVDTV